MEWPSVLADRVCFLARSRCDGCGIAGVMHHVCIQGCVARDAEGGDQGEKLVEEHPV